MPRSPRPHASPSHTVARLHALACAGALATLSCGSRTGLLVPADAPQFPDVVDVATAMDAPRDVPPDVPIPVTCGDGRVDTGEECDLGADNALIPAFAVAQPPDLRERAVRPIARGTTVGSFYSYTSASAHTGIEAVGLASLMLYVDTRFQDLGLVFVAGRDFEGGASAQPESAMRGTLRGLPSGTRIAISDDSGEILEGAPGEFIGTWTYVQNTDGAALAGIDWDREWVVTADFTFTAGVDRYQYVSAEPANTPVPLTLNRAAQIIHRVRPSACRPDCRVPRCGDGYLDAGERCDDGNTRAGDGCSARCDRFE